MKELERELHRKDKALAETAAVLALRGIEGKRLMYRGFGSAPNA